MRRPHFPQPRRLSVAVLSGGDSDERELSLSGGRAVAAALRARGHEVVCVDPAASPPEAAHFREVDIAFLVLHGRKGEDGQIQTLLERMGVLYTGSGPEASRLAFSKSASKERFFQCGVPTPPYGLVHESDGAARARELAERIGYPLVVKPDTRGSSLGVSRVSSGEYLAEALQQCFRYDAFGLLERAVDGTEWTLGLLDDEPLPLIQIEPPGDVFDRQAKRAQDASLYRFEFAIGAKTASAIVEAGRRAAAAIATRGPARVDLRLDGDGRAWVLEVNTIPGMTERSLLPLAAARAGIGLGELCERSIEGCLSAASRGRPVPSGVPLLRGPHRASVWRAERKRA